MTKAKDIEPEKKGRGRPSKFDGIDQKQAEMLARKGWTDEEMSAFFHVTRRTWDNWKKTHAEFFRTIKDWKAEADEKVEKSLYERACGYSHPEEKIFCSEGRIIRAETRKRYPPDTAAAFIWLKNRKPKEWRDQPAQGTQSEDMENLFKAAAKVMESHA